VDGWCEGYQVHRAREEAFVILLDTNALIWLSQQHKRARPLSKATRLYVSPATLLELQFLTEAGKLRFRAGASPASLVDDDRWVLDEPPAARWFSAAAELSWTRDPFDRLIVGHARTRRWKLATGDSALLAKLNPTQVLGL
jgi:PIN domain nuclease of toxin-antitoxin system